MTDIWMDVDAAVTVPVNIFPLTDDTDFKSIEPSVAYNAAGLELIWNFVTTAGAQTHTAVTPTDTGGNYDWVNIGHGMYNIEIPASGGATINNDTEGFGWFTGVATGVLPWRSPVIGFRAAALNNSNVDGTTIDVNVTAMANNVVTANAVADGAIDAGAIATDAIDADAIKADAIAEIQSGLATASALATVDGILDNIHDTDLPAVKTDTASILADTGTDGVVVKALGLAADAVAEIADGVWDEIMTGHSVVDSMAVHLDNIITFGTGSIQWTYTLLDGDGDPIADALVEVSTLADGSNIIATGITNASGVATFWLDAGTYYLFSHKAGYSFSNPDTEVVS